MEKREFLKSLAIGGLGGLAAGVLSRPASHVDPAKLEKFNQRFEEILATRKFRAGWITYAPYFMKDPNTGAFSGIFYDLTVKIAALAELEVEWAPETTWATVGQDLEMMRTDIHCGGLWPNTGRASLMTFSDAAFFAGLEIYCTPEFARKNLTLNDLNNPSYRMAVLDGEMSSVIQRSEFSNVKILSLPQNTSVSELLTNIATSKADFTVVERSVAIEYQQANPNKIIMLPNSKPIRAFPSCFAVARDNMPMLNVLEVALRELIYSGYVDTILAKYEKVPGSLYRVASSFQTPDA